MILNRDVTASIDRRSGVEIFKVGKIVIGGSVLNASWGSIVTLAEELHSLDQLQQDGKLTAEEFAKAKQLLLGEPLKPVDLTAPMGVERRLETIQIQNELAQLDREWQQSIPTYEFTGRYGQRFLPNGLSGLIYIVFGGGCGLFWAFASYLFAEQLTQFPPLDWFFYALAILAALFAATSILRGLAHLVVSQNYAAAAYRYQTRRAAAVARLPKPTI